MLIRVKTPPSELARQLLDASDQILSPSSLMRFDDIAKLVGVSRAGLYYYFAGRNDLVSFVLHAHVTEGAAAIKDGDPGPDHPPFDRLRSALDAIIQYLSRRPAVCIGLLASVGEGDRLAEVLAANDAHIATPLRKLLELGIADGSLQSQSSHDAVNAIMGAILMTVIGRRDPRATASADTAPLIAQLLSGIEAHSD